MVNDLPIYKITIDPEYSDGEDLGIEQIAFTDNPAIKVKGFSFKNVEKRFFSDDLKYRVVAPAMIPMEIYRRDDEAGDYYVQFDEATIEQIYVKFMKDLSNKNVFNLEHDPSKEVPAYILESWIVENPKQDKAFTTYNIEVPKGTLMLTAQVTDVDYYNELVKNEQLGFSIEGFLGMKLSKHLNKYNMNFPDGEHQINDKIYVVKDGEVVEIKDAPVEEVAMAEVTEEVTEEVAMSETSVEEEVVEEEEATVPVEEEMAIDPAMDTEAILAIVKPLVEEQVNAVIGMIADLKNQMEELLIKEEEVEDMNMNNVKMSAFDKFKAFRTSNK
ncbi:Phage-like element PBSX protein, XkdF [uncultured Caudovirales phage]|uniref:Phage-like element PBSX protein, XkdF n=1 Tax=uncultured Caudovirales phage TaxID=2100421 RepID=A0A6J5LJ67_9CAUD|nr:Phage-like element PBSX protein, XkdF [uncultured Caudovirales phage]